MASVDWSEHLHSAGDAKAMFRHCAEDSRMEQNHSNKDIRKDLTYMNLHFGDMASYDRACSAFDARMEELERSPKRNRRKDRVRCLGLCVHAPEGMDDVTSADWFMEVYQIFEDWFGADNMIGGAVHFDEIHDYRDARTKKLVTSRAHMHVYVVPEKDGKLNCNKVSSEDNIRKMNYTLDAMTKSKFKGFHFLTGEKYKGKSVEELKRESRFLEQAYREVEAQALADAREEADRITAAAYQEMEEKEEWLYSERERLADLADEAESMHEEASARLLEASERLHKAKLLEEATESALEEAKRLKTQIKGEYARVEHEEPDMVEFLKRYSVGGENLYDVYQKGQGVKKSRRRISDEAFRRDMEDAMQKCGMGSNGMEFGL